MNYVVFNSDEQNDPLEIKFYREKDYDRLLQVLKDERENPFGLFREVYKQNKERNPDFLNLSLRGIDRKQSNVWKKWEQIDFSNSQMKIETQVHKDPDFRFYEDLKKFISELQNPKEEPKEIQIQKPKGKPILNREQTALLFYYLREKRLIAPTPQNQNLAAAIELLTGYSAKQFRDILKRPETPVYQLGKDQKGIKRTDLKELKNQLQTVLNKIDTDLAQYKDEIN
jgi:hypothetical protein